jgi:hypothetical protein
MGAINGVSSGIPVANYPPCFDKKTDMNMLLKAQ